MNIRITVSTFIIITSLCVNSGLLFGDEWNKEFTKNGVTVYTRAVEGSNFKEFKGIAMVNAPMEVCQKVLMDISALKEWMPDCSESRLLKQENSGSVVYAYNRTKAPWPVSDRDVVTRSVLTKKEDRITHSITASGSSLVPRKSGVVRITDMNAYWVLIEKGERTLAVYRVRANPGGSIPAWLANKSSTNMPYKTLLGLRRMADMDKYR